MSDSDLIIADTHTALSPYGERDDVRELGDRLMAMHPAANEVGANAMRAAAQLALLLGANPLPGVNEVHIWKDEKGRVCMSLGVNYWRRKAEEWGGVLWDIRPRAMKTAEATEYSIPNGQTAAICRGVRTEKMIALKQLGFTANEIWDMAAATGIGMVGPNEYAKKGKPPLWTALKRAETDMLRQLFPAQFSKATARMTDVPAIVTVTGGDQGDDDDVIDIVAEEVEPEPKTPYTLADANRDLFGDTPSTRPNGTPPPSPLDAYLAQAEQRTAVQAAAFADGRLRSWANYVTDNAFDPAKAEYLNQVLDLYCAVVADNDGLHTKAAAEKARADYRQIVTAMAASDAGAQSDLFNGATSDAAQQAALATAQGQMN